ncbi:restriction endonuclease subunit S [Parapusillimonas sp. SGNA-6]|nr:restriction endonuclease subunit S [Parapusillimonas sp. SGNA-6]
MMKKIKSNYTQIRTLTALRDTLLPKLMSGEVRVEEAKKYKAWANFNSI